MTSALIKAAHNILIIIWKYLNTNTEEVLYQQLVSYLGNFTVNISFFDMILNKEQIKMEDNFFLLHFKIR